MNMMKAVRIHHLGGPEVLQYEDASYPKPAEDEVLVRVHAAGINPADWKTRAGFQPTRQPIAFPYILGWDISGVIRRLGADRVVDYHTPDLEHCASEVDIVFDATGGSNGPRLVSTMKRGGTYVSIAWSLPSAERAIDAGITAQPMLVHPDAQTLVEFARLIDRSTITPRIEQVFPLAKVRDAHELGERGHVRGKLVLDCLAA